MSQSRRDLLEALLGVAGAGTAMSLLQGCAVPAGDPTNSDVLVSQSALNASSTIVQVFETLAALRSEAIDGSTLSTSPRAAILLGRSAPGDGGGGVFLAVPGASGEDNGTTFVPTAANNSGAWRRIYSGPLDIRWFGASLTSSDNSPAIQGAINSAQDRARFPRGASIYVPTGDWVIQSQLTIKTPYVSGEYDPPGLTIRGDGPEVSRIKTAESSFVGGSVLLITDEGTNANARNITIEGLTLWRQVDEGNVLTHTSAPFGRLDHCTFRNLTLLLGPLLGVGQYGQGRCLAFERVFDSLFENIHAKGGEITVSLKDSSRCTFVGLRAPLVDGQSRTALYISGGGLHHFIATRIENCGTSAMAGTGVHIVNSRYNRFDTLSFEGQKSTNPILITGSQDILFTNAIIAGPGSTGQWAVAGNAVTLSQSKRIRFIGGAIGQGQRDTDPGSTITCSSNTCMSIAVDNCTDVSFDDVATGAGGWAEQKVGIAFSATGIPPDAEFARNVNRFRARFIGSAGPFGVPIGDAYINDGKISMRGFDKWRLKPDGAQLHRVEDATPAGVEVEDGHVVTLLGSGTAGVAVFADGNLRLGQGSPSVVLKASSTIAFMYDRATRTWLEVSRSIEL